MRLSSVFIRFYKSFNIDLDRKFDNGATRFPWEIIKSDDNNVEMFYPYIKIDIQSDITAIVGANESGKSHLLTAIEKAIHGKDYQGKEITVRDFCRYSERFSVVQRRSRIPDLGTEWVDLSPKESETIDKLVPLEKNKKRRPIERFYLFRNNGNELTIYLPNGTSSQDGSKQYLETKLNPSENKTVLDLLPKTRRLERDVKLPSRIPIKQLVMRIQEKVQKQPENLGFNRYEVASTGSRKEMLDLSEQLLQVSREISEHTLTPGNLSSDCLNRLKQTVSALDEVRTNSNTEQQNSIDLAYKLICKVAKVTPEALIDLAEAMQDDDSGNTQALIDHINRQLSSNLNFPQYWVQDSKFSLVISAKDHDLEFNIIDRTGTKYSFEERSQGLQYFLGYFIQHRSYELPDNKSEIILMDEPDTYLSSQAQQDLLKIFEEVVVPKDEKPSSQVVYVTHSPFLIDKNHSTRIRVLQKGNDYEGTQLVKGCSQNHYEPLRSAFGSFVAETVYISHCNLMVEGQADQVLLAGAATYLRSLPKVAKDTESLNLNTITIVPSGGAKNIVYLTYLARGRDKEQPAVIVLLDSDGEGNETKKILIGKEFAPIKSVLLKNTYILQIGDLKKYEEFKISEGINLLATEDLIPLPIAIKAAQKFALEIYGIRDLKISEQMVLEKIQEKTSLLEALNLCCNSYLKKQSEEQELSTIKKMSMGKVAFAKTVIETVKELREEYGKDFSSDKNLDQFECNFKILFRQINTMKQEAELERSEIRASEKIKNHVQSFLDEHPSRATREDGHKFLKKLNSLLASDDRNEAQQLKDRIEKIYKDYELNLDQTEAIKEYDKFKVDIQGLCHPQQGRKSEIQQEQQEGLSVSEETEHSESTK